MFQALTQTNAVITTLANQNATGYVQADHTMGSLPLNTRDLPYGMPYEKKNAGNNSKTGPEVNANSAAGPHDRVGPHAQQDSVAQHQVSWNTMPFVIHRWAPQAEVKWQSLEERLRGVEGGNSYGLEAVDLCLVLDVGLLANFKTLEFDKYKGSSYPRVHLAMYCRKMVAYIYDNKVLIHCFQDSLTGATLSWYVSLE
ncbi:hypothetical protein CR513_57555, partial [Mucuna pruriens]